MGRLESAAASLINRVTTNVNGFGTIITFNNKLGVTVNCGGIAIRHHLAFTPNGEPVNSLTARVSVSEIALTALMYPVRNAANEVSMIGHLITWTDVLGIERTYVIKAVFPGDTFGILVFNLGQYKVV